MSGDIKKLEGDDGLYRLRVGDYRVLFELHGKSMEVILVEVTDAGNRGEIYK
ncbi:MAG: type II toxin-antitoxin system RelE/ParE family toxin [Candidatus Ornithomonoglobus sp.]